MATQLQIRRGTSAQVAAFTGAEGEIVVNTTNDSVHVNDGSTAGGFELARADLNNVSDTSLNAALTGNTVSALTVTALTSSGIDVAGTVVSDGATIAGTLELNSNKFNHTALTPSYNFIESDVTGENTQFLQASGTLRIRTVDDSGSNVAERLRVDHSTGDISFYNNSGTSQSLHWDSSAESLGIGTTSPTGNLEIATSASDTGVDLVLDGNKTSNGGIGSIIFNNNGDSVGMIRSNRASANDAAEMLFYTQATGGANTQRMAITKDGNLLVGKTAVSLGVVGVEVKSFGEVRATASGAQALQLNRLSTDGTIADFRKDGTAVGSIGTQGGRLTIGDGDTGLRFADDFNNIQPFNLSTNALRDNAIDLGSTAGRFKDLYLSGIANVDGSVKYGAGANAGTLQNLKVSIGTSATLAIDMGDVVTSDKGAGFYMVSIVRSAGSYGRHFVGIFGVNGGNVVLYETLRSSGNVTVTVSGTQIKASSTSATVFDVNAIPLAVDKDA